MGSKSASVMALAAVTLSLQALPAAAAEGDWLVRGGVGVVDPKSDNLTIDPSTVIEVGSGTSATIEGTYFFADRWAVELLAAWPFSHDVDIQGAGKVAEADCLPPTLSLQYHFIPDGRFRPYVGAGLNWTLFFNEGTEGALAGTDLELDDSFGLAAQVGLDIGINDRWFANAVIRYIDIDADAKLDGSALGTVEIDPVVYQVQAGYRFGQ